MHRLVLLALASLLATALPATALPGTAGAPPAAPCALPTAGVLLADGLRQGCTPDLGAFASVSRAALAGPCVPTPVLDDRCETWLNVDSGPSGPGEGILGYRTIAASPDGRTAYLAGLRDADPGLDVDADTVVSAYDTTSGAQRWTTTVAGDDEHIHAIPYGGLVVDAAGTTVAVGLTFTGEGTATGVALVLDAATGAQRVLTSTGEGTAAYGVAIAPDGSQVVLAGGAALPAVAGGKSALLATAIDTASGAVAWSTTWRGPTGRGSGYRVATNPVDGRVYVAGSGLDDGGATTVVGLLTLDPVTGELLNLVERPSNGFPPAGIATSPDGSLVVVEEASLENGGTNSALTLAFNADGTPRWTAQYRGCDVFKCSTRPWYSGPVAVSPDSSRVLVTGLGVVGGGWTALATVSYDAATGAEQWAVRTPGNAGDCFCGPQVDVGSDTVYITSLLHSTLETFDATTVAFDIANGNQRWSAIRRDGANNTSSSQLVATAQRLVVAGVSTDAVTGIPNLVVSGYTP